MNDSNPKTLAGLRSAARRLLDDLRGADPARAHRAAERFARLRSLAARGAAALQADPDSVQLEHALAVLAEEHGATSWTELERRWTTAPPAAETTPSFYTPRLSALLNRWFVDHDEALASQRALGGYLLPFRDQFVVTESEGVRELGLDPDDPDWTAVGFDLARPRDRGAFARLCARRERAIEATGSDPDEVQR